MVTKHEMVTKWSRSRPEMFSEHVNGLLLNLRPAGK